MDRSNWSRQPWLLVDHGDLEVEKKQCTEEGKDLTPLLPEFEALAALDLSVEANQRRAEALLDAAEALPVQPGWPRNEPSDLEGIRAQRPTRTPLPAGYLCDGGIADRALGAWQGRAAGCLLGKPAEGRRAWQIEKYLKAQGRWPLDRYFSMEVPEELARECGFPVHWPGLFEEGITCMVEDDDTNYTATGLAILKQHGHDFTPADVASFWLNNIPIFHVCTAERAAYRNLVMGYGPPDSARFRNVYREWIGAQIRADFFGYVCPGDPERAAEYAWRDASISHIKNGIYGEMWVAAMLAAAYVQDDMRAIIQAGLEQVPATCRLATGVATVMDQHARGFTFDEAIADFATRWNENLGHDWCHTISNAELVTVALLWGDLDFEKTITLAVIPGFDTDCNGATAGSVLGMRLGAVNLPAKWIAPMNDTLLTGVAGYHKVSLTQMARETVELMKR